MRKVYLLLIFLLGLFISSCATHKGSITNKEVHHNNQQVQKANKQGNTNNNSYTSLTYIERFKAIAIQEMNLYGIPASITLAQGLLESNSGNSELARVANNHFGIKCTKDWKGKGYYKNDDHPNECFRVYDHAEDSFRDHSEFLKKPRYAKLFQLGKSDYTGWANGLKAAGYATNPKYPQLLINIIEKYYLDQYDSSEKEDQGNKPILVQHIYHIVPSKKDSVNQTTSVTKMYTVVTGDTLYSISKRFGLTIEDIKALNNMDDNTIKIGQQLVVTK